VAPASKIINLKFEIDEEEVCLILSSGEKMSLFESSMLSPVSLQNSLESAIYDLTVDWSLQEKAGQEKGVSP
jgi:hypothetical protein